MSDISSKDLELFHYGVKGMKWGVKRPVGSDGLVSRGAKVATKGAKVVGKGVAKGKLQDNKDMIRVHESIRDRKSGTKGEKVLRVASAPDRILLGKKRFEKYHNKRIDRLKSQNERIESGKTTTRDKLDIALNTPMYQIYRGNR